MPLTMIGAEAVRKIADLPPPPPDALGPLRLADESMMRGMLAAAHFKDITVERIPVTLKLASPSDFAQFRVDIAAPFRALLRAPDGGEARTDDRCGRRRCACLCGRRRPRADHQRTICYAATR